MATQNTEAMLDKLFRWKKTVEIDGEKYYMRVVSDQVIDDARRAALLASRKLRRSVRDTNSDDHLIHLDPLNDLLREELINMIILIAVRDTMRDYMQNTPRPIMEPLSDSATQEEQENYEEEKEKRDDEYIKAMQEYTEQWRKDFTEGLEARTDEQLLHLAKRYRVDQICEEEFTRTFEEYVVAASLYKDEKYKERKFTLEQFKQLPTQLKVKFVDAYNSLIVSADDIKN